MRVGTPGRLSRRAAALTSRIPLGVFTPRLSSFPFLIVRNVMPFGAGPGAPPAAPAPGPAPAAALPWRSVLAVPAAIAAPAVFKNVRRLLFIGLPPFGEPSMARPGAWTRESEPLP